MKALIARYNHIADSPKSGWVLLVFALLLRVLVGILLSGKGFHGDAAQYLVESERYLEGFEGEPFWPPILPLWLAGIQQIAGNSELIIRFSMLLWFVLLYYSVSGLAQQLGGKRVAFGVGLLISVYPEFVLQSVEPLSYIPAAAILCVMLWAIWRSLASEKSLFLALAGGLGGILVLLRPSALLILPVLAIWLAWKAKNWKGAGVFAFSSAILPLLWTLMLTQSLGYGMFINRANSLNFYIGNNPVTPDYETWYWGSHWCGDVEFRAVVDHADSLPAPAGDRYLREQAFAYIASEPVTFARHSLSRIRTFFAFDTVAASSVTENYGAPKWASAGILGLGLILYFGICSIFILQKRENQFSHSSFQSKQSPQYALAPLLLFTLLLWSIPYFLAFSHPTYHLPILPLLFILALTQLHEAHRISLKEIPWHRWLIWIAFVGIQLEWLIRVVIPKI